MKHESCFTQHKLEIKILKNFHVLKYYYIPVFLAHCYAFISISIEFGGQPLGLNNGYISVTDTYFNFLKPTGHVMHQQV